MGRIAQKFEELQAQGMKAFIAYITAGDPSLDSTERLVREFEARGVDIIELGVPFSDPVADGPVNQEAAMRALKGDVTVDSILKMIRNIREYSQIPVIFFTYYNSVLSFGLEKFVKKATESGLDGALVLDLPPEEAGQYKKLMDAEGLSTIFLVSPITPSDRLELVAKNATGFVYYVSQMGVTGERDNLAESIPEKLQAIRALTSTPIAVGFGISTPEHVRGISRYADGIIVGSSIVRKIGELSGKPGFEKEVGEYVATLTEPLKGD
ncbi:MAG: tryptophan synthase subunit alpha [Candidatus Latescibacteria bacterium]|nr:tryptophan synthase subunit alpha [Candidatus Latescibacterota bacterium]